MSMRLVRAVVSRWRRLALSVSCAVAVVVTAGTLTAAASGPASAARGGPRPTIVFVHGAFADSSGWNAEVAVLRRLGYPVLAAPNPLRGLSSDADYVRSILQTIAGPIVLVGHSYGGAVITNAARGVSNVQSLVYVGAFIPDRGESIASVLDPQRYPGSLLGTDTTLVRPFPAPASPGGVDYDIYIRPEEFRRVFAADVPARTADLMAATQRPLSLTANTELSGDPAWRTIPSWSLIALDDRAIPAAGQRFMAQRAHAQVRTVHSSHAVMVSHPDAVVTIVLAAANRG